MKYKCQVELELKVDHKFKSLKPIICKSTLEAREELRCKYKEYLNKWGNNDGVIYDNNDIFCFVIDRKKGNEFKARVIEESIDKDSSDN